MQGLGLLKAAVPQINIQALTRLSKDEQGVMGDGAKTISSEVEERKAWRSGEFTKQHKRKINDRCLNRLSAALAKTRVGFMHRRRNSTFLGKDLTKRYSALE